jgi:DNA ligase-1
MSTFEILTEIRTTAGAAGKKAILRKYANDNTCNIELLKNLLVSTAKETDVRYGVKALEKVPPGTKTFEEISEELFILLDDLANRRLTGNAAKNACKNLQTQMNADAQWIFSGIIARNLKIGLSSESINEVFPKLISVYKVSRAHHLNDKYREIIRCNPREWFMSRKMDGIRTNIWFDMKDNVASNVRIFSREGTPILTFDNLKAPVLETFNDPDKNAFVMPDGTYILDGETCIIDSEGKENFRAIISEWNKKNHTVEHPFFIVLDLVTEAEWNGTEQSPVFKERNEFLNALSWDSQFMRVLEQIPVTSIEQVDAFQQQAVANGWEGSMLRRNRPYVRGESWDMLKNKGVYDAEFRVKSLEISDQTFSVVGKGQQTFNCVAALIIDFDGFEVRVGGGMSLEEKLYWKDHPEEIVGKLVTVAYNEIFVLEDGSKSLRFPRLKAVIGTKRLA